MRFEIDFDNMPKFAFIRTEGEASCRGFDECLTELVESPEWIPGTDQLVDHGKLLMTNLTSNELKNIRDMIKKHSGKLGNGRVAFVVSDSLGYGMARMYELIGGENIHGDVKIFYSLSEAVSWLT